MFYREKSTVVTEIPEKSYWELFQQNQVHPYIWTPEYWVHAGDDEDYYWVPGTWAMAPSPGLLWAPGFWGEVGDGYAWNERYWDR